jgi:hypothetical protein
VIFEHVALQQATSLNDVPLTSAFLEETKRCFSDVPELARPRISQAVDDRHFLFPQTVFFFPQTSQRIHHDKLPLRDFLTSFIGTNHSCRPTLHNHRQRGFKTINICLT